MNDERESWTGRVVDDEAAQIPRAPWDRSTPFRRMRGGERLGAMVAIAALAVLALGVAVTYTNPRRGIVESPKTPAPTFSRNDSGTPLPTEAEIWGGIWSRANGMAALRPTWLPKSEDEYQVFGTDPSLSALAGYQVLYFERRIVPGTIAWSVEFSTDSLEHPTRGLFPPTGASEKVTVRGHAAELTSIGTAGWQLVWSEGGDRYSVRGLAISRQDFLRIIDSLAPVIDGTGRTAP